MLSRTEVLARLRAELGRRTLVMGVLNVTPDSFYDGGRYLRVEDALARAQQMISEGADILDVGGESTRPGSEAVPVQEELRRVLPVVEALATHTQVALSLDTYKAEVAKRALEAGAHLVNDVSAMRFDPEMPSVVTKYGAGIILMHLQGTPRTMQQNPVYEDAVREIRDFLAERAQFAQQVGVPAEHIWLDPGIGFGKTLEHNLQILRNLQAFKALGYPLLIGTSRKSFIGKILGDLPPEERLEGTLATLALAVAGGADIVRVHDVKEAVRAVRVADAILR